MTLRTARGWLLFVSVRQGNTRRAYGDVLGKLAGRPGADRQLPTVDRVASAREALLQAPDRLPRPPCPHGTCR